MDDQLKAELSALLTPWVDASERHSESVHNFVETASNEIDKLWISQAQVNEELRAMANRVEALTRAVMGDAA